MNTTPFENLLYTFRWAHLILEEIPLQASNLQELRREKQAHNREIGSYVHLALGMASAKRFASSANSASSRTGAARADALRLKPRGFLCDESLVGALSGDSGGDGDDGDEGESRDGKKHMKMPSACHLVALAKLTQTSVRLGLLRAGYRCSIFDTIGRREKEPSGMYYSSRKTASVGKNTGDAPAFRASAAASPSAVAMGAVVASMDGPGH